MGNFSEKNRGMDIKMKKIMIGICTYNRKELIEYTSRSLREIEGIQDTCVRVFDDCSTEYDEQYLKNKYPMADRITINKENLGADYNTQKLFKSFIDSDNEYLFIADSDLVFNTNVLKHIEDGIQELEEKNEIVIFSLFNAHTHKTIGNYSERFEIKKDIGSAGAVISKEAVKKFIDKQYSGEVSFDNFYCNMLTKEGAKILCTKNSYVQHIGIVGQNSFLDSVDMGINFKVDTINNAEAIIDVLQKAFIWHDMNNIDEMLVSYTIKGKIKIKTLFKCIWICFKRKVRNIIK